MLKFYIELDIGNPVQFEKYQNDWVTEKQIIDKWGFTRFQHQFKNSFRGVSFVAK